MKLSSLGVALLVAAAPRTAGPTVLVEPEKTTVDGGGAVSVTVTNGGRAPIFLPTCQALTFERLEGETYVELSPEPCAAEAEAIRLMPKEKRVVTATPIASGAHILRPMVTFGVGCRPGLPLDQAECERFEVVRGRYVSWGHAPAAP